MRKLLMIGLAVLLLAPATSYAQRHLEAPTPESDLGNQRPWRDLNVSRNVNLGGALSMGSIAELPLDSDGCVVWGGDTYLCRDAANTLCVRNSTAAQKLNIYATYTDASNYERGFFRTTATELQIGTEALGTGVGRGMRLDPSNNVITTDRLIPVTTDAYYVGTAGNLYISLGISRSIQGSKSKALTDATAATPFMTVAVPTNGWAGGELIWTATSVSGADQLVANGRVRFWGTDTAGTPVCGINVIGTDGEGHSGGANTLVCTWTNVVSTTFCALSVTCTNDLAAAQAITLYGRADMPTTNTLAFP